jgi:hypothetical protein
MSRRSRTAFAVAAGLAAAAALYLGWLAFGPRRVPAGQPELVRLDALPAFVEAFNASHGKPRILALFSPT